jgi:hypothetical protein
MTYEGLTPIFVELKITVLRYNQLREEMPNLHSDILLYPRLFILDD